MLIDKIKKLIRESDSEWEKEILLDFIIHIENKVAC